jgi:hypothetical protein
VTPAVVIASYPAVMVVLRRDWTVVLLGRMDAAVLPFTQMMVGRCLVFVFSANDRVSRYLQGTQIGVF